MGLGREGAHHRWEGATGAQKDGGMEQKKTEKQRQRDRDTKKAEKRQTEFERYRQAEAETEVDRDKIHRERWEDRDGRWIQKDTNARDR